MRLAMPADPLDRGDCVEKVGDRSPLLKKLNCRLFGENGKRDKRRGFRWVRSAHIWLAQHCQPETSLCQRTAHVPAIAKAKSATGGTTCAHGGHETLGGIKKTHNVCMRIIYGFCATFERARDRR